MEDLSLKKLEDCNSKVSNQQGQEIRMPNKTSWISEPFIFGSKGVFLLPGITKADATQIFVVSYIYTVCEKNNVGN